MPEENLCVLIDFENIAAGTERENLGKFNIRLVMNRLKEKGRILISRAYGDWGRFAKFKQHMLEQGIQMMELTSYRGQEKNRADIALVVDAMELAFSRDYINTYVLLSGDSDFTPLVMKLRELNKRVIGLGVRKSTSRLLSESCDEFIFYDNLLRRAKGKGQEETQDLNEVVKSLTKDDAFALLVDTLEGFQREHPGPVQAGIVKQFMLRKVPTFDETDMGYSGFTKFLESGQKRGLVKLVLNEKGGGYNVDLYDSNAEVVPEINESIPLPENPDLARLYDVLTGKGFHPTTQLMRHTVVHEFVDHVLQRRALKKRNTLVFTYGDLNRICRKTEPMVPPQYVREIINALHSCGELFGSDGKPVRSKKASFVIHKDADELMKCLQRFYVEVLIESGENISNIAAISELIWGDNEHISEVNNILTALKNKESSPNTTSEKDTTKLEVEEVIIPIKAPPIKETEKKPRRRTGSKQNTKNKPTTNQKDKTTEE
jgi:uncharacterized protein (TIGR00288 family)